MLEERRLSVLFTSEYEAPRDLAALACYQRSCPPGRRAALKRGCILREHAQRLTLRARAAKQGRDLTRLCADHAGAAADQAPRTPTRPAGTPPPERSNRPRPPAAPLARAPPRAPPPAARRPAPEPRARAGAPAAKAAAGAEHARSPGAPAAGVSAAARGAGGGGPPGRAGARAAAPACESRVSQQAEGFLARLLADEHTWECPEAGALADRPDGCMERRSGSDKAACGAGEHAGADLQEAGLQGSTTPRASACPGGRPAPSGHSGTGAGGAAGRGGRPAGDPTYVSRRLLRASAARVGARPLPAAPPACAQGDAGMFGAAPPASPRAASASSPALSELVYELAAPAPGPDPSHAGSPGEPSGSPRDDRWGPAAPSEPWQDRGPGSPRRAAATSRSPRLRSGGAAEPGEAASLGVGVGVGSTYDGLDQLDDRVEQRSRGGSSGAAESITAGGAWGACADALAEGAGELSLDALEAWIEALGRAVPGSPHSVRSRAAAQAGAAGAAAAPAERRAAGDPPQRPPQLRWPAGGAGGAAASHDVFSDLGSAARAWARSPTPQGGGAAAQPSGEAGPPRWARACPSGAPALRRGVHCWGATLLFLGETPDRASHILSLFRSAEKNGSSLVRRPWQRTWQPPGRRCMHMHRRPSVAPAQACSRRRDARAPHRAMRSPQELRGRRRAWRACARRARWRRQQPGRQPRWQRGERPGAPASLPAEQPACQDAPACGVGRVSTGGQPRASRSRGACIAAAAYTDFNIRTTLTARHTTAMV